MSGQTKIRLPGMSIDTDDKTGIHSMNIGGTVFSPKPVDHSKLINCRESLVRLNGKMQYFKQCDYEEKKGYFVLIRVR